MQRLRKGGNLGQRWIPSGGGVLLLTAAAVLAGCSRAHYRESADEETYQILAEKASDARWCLPETDITPDERSRFYDPYDPDCPPLPPDDPAAHAYMHCVDGKHGWKHWHDLGQTEHVENPDWPISLGGTRLEFHNGKLPKIEKLGLSEAMELGLLHSREYQEQLENVYLSALGLTWERYRFNVRPSGFLGEPGTAIRYDDSAGEPGVVRLGTSNIGFRKLFPAGAQFMTELTNNTLWMFSSSGGFGTATSFAYSLVQPLLRGASREIVLERLTQAERNVLYTIRRFARFRKDFFVMILTGERAVPLPGSTGQNELAFLIRGERSPTVGFFYLLVQYQRVRNRAANVRSLERRLRDVRAMSREKMATSLDVTQVQTSLENARSFQIFRARFFGDQLDRFKLQLGLPPDMDVEIDDSLLEPFEFYNPELEELEDRLRGLDDTIESIRSAPEVPDMLKLVQEMTSVREKLDTAFAVAEKKIEELHQVVPLRSLRMSKSESADFKQTVDKHTQRFGDLSAQFKDARAELRQVSGQLDATTLIDSEKVPMLDRIVSLRDRLAQTTRRLNGVETSTRVELIALTPVDLTAEDAVKVALENRVDLMNRRGIVMDARRRLEIAADRLEATVDIVAEGNVSTRSIDDGNDNPLDFRKDESSFRAGIAVTTPLDRQRERNDFRAAQVSYQRARRNYMAAEDQVKLDVRHRLRVLRAEGSVFEIQRRALRIAARELEQALDAGARQQGQETSAIQQGLSIPRALENILDSQDSLIDTWLDYETARLELFRDMGVMQIDEHGVWSEESQRQWTKPENGDHNGDDELLDVP